MKSRIGLVVVLSSVAVTVSGQQPAERWATAAPAAGGYKAAEDFGKVYLAVVAEVANRPTRPQWNADSFFRRFAQ